MRRVGGGAAFPCPVIIGVALIIGVAACTGGEPAGGSMGGPAGGSGGSRAAQGAIDPALIDRVIGPFNRGVALMDQFRPAEAAEAFAEVVRVAPEWITGRLDHGIALLNAQTDTSYARAEDELKWVIARAPDNPYAHYALGMLLKHLDRPDEARAQFEEVLRIDPDDADAHFQLGVLLVDRAPEEARRHLEATLERMPHHESAAYRLGTLLRRMDRPDSARRVLLRFQALKSAGAGVATGMKYGEMGRYAEIVRAFEAPPAAAGDASPPRLEDVAEAVGLSVGNVEGVAGWPGEGGAADADAFGPGVAVARVEAGGGLAIFLPGAGEGRRGVLYRFVDGRFAPVPNTGIDARGAIGAYFGDYDGDGDADLYLTRAGPNRLYRNDGGAHFTDVTRETGTAGGDVLSVGAAWADADHDGDLDLYVANYAPAGGGSRGNVGAAGRGAPNALWRNNGDGTFTDVAPDAGIDGGRAATTGVLFLDLDGDRDFDLYVINDHARNRIFLNDRVGRYTDATGRYRALADDGGGLGAALGDLDGNGLEDILLIRGSEPPSLFLQERRGRFGRDRTFDAMAAALGGAVGALPADLDLDGDLDLVLLGSGPAGRSVHRVLMNRGSGRFGAPVPFAPARAAPDARGAVVADFDGDGALEVLVARAGARPELWRGPAPEGRHWLEVVPMKTGEDGVVGGDPSGDGMLIEIKAGRALQVTGITTSMGFLGSFPRRAHVGLGAHAKADYVRLTWNDAVLQSEMEVPADQRWRVTKVQRKPSSCPVLFAWNGERFVFVTDFLGVGGLGFFQAPGAYAPPDPTEDVRIPPESIAEHDGRYRLRIAEPLEEVTYLDQLHLIAYDHPAGWEVYPDERFGGSGPAPTGRPFAVAEKIFPAAAHDERGTDVLDRILEIDRRSVDVPRDPRFVGYTRDHWVELDFGDRLKALDPAMPLVLYLYGWVEYTYSHVNYAAYQAGVAMHPPSIEIPDGRGGWRTAVVDAGFPAGLPRMMTLDISTLPIRSDARMRIRSNMEVFWDQVFVAQDVSSRRLRRHVLESERAELRPLGYPREYSPDGADPTLYDYQRVDQGVPFKNLTGDYTRFGDVRELLARVDDRFVVMGRGEEVVLDFDATTLPPLPDGWTRTLVLHADGYCKDMDLYTAYPSTVDPLPFHGMRNYPPTEQPPRAAALRKYVERWNTRRIVGR